MPKSPSNRSRLTLDTDKFSDKYSNYSENFETDDGRSTRITEDQKVHGRLTKKTMGNKGRRTNQSNYSPRNQHTGMKRKSPRLMKSSEFRNRINELQMEVKEVKMENAILKKQQRIQERSIYKYEHAHANLPSVLKSQIAELRNLQEQLRRQEDIEEEINDKLKDDDFEINKLKREIKKLKKISEDNHIQERIDLQSKLEKVEKKAAEAEKKADSMELCLENSKNNHSHEIKSFKGKYKRLLQRIEDMEEEADILKVKLKEKEKELDIRNVYSRRIVKIPHKLPKSVSPVLSSPRHRSDSLKSLGKEIERRGRENYFIYDGKVRKNYKIKKEEFERDLREKFVEIDKYDYKMHENQRREKNGSPSKSPYGRKNFDIDKRRQDEIRDQNERDEFEELQKKSKELEEIAYKERIQKERKEQEEIDKKLKEEEEKRRKLESEKKAREEKLKNDREEKEKAKEAAIAKEKRKQLNALKEKLAAMDANKSQNEKDEDLWNRPVNDIIKDDDNSYYSSFSSSAKKPIKKNLLSNQNSIDTNKIESPEINTQSNKPKGRTNSKTPPDMLDEIEDQVEELVLL
ncbi:DgyrCDS10148 [Dimorphilus gyrociliatus]|uniref:DgyrCDS10148 n=1 Tax=Dimorphilus gyrociliatus TaxID=2664684 RepID=A0A7I8W0I5_9ANNE|nr:DgyrCDS10148 [Dimorphilus gyrociliatus]